MSTLESDIPIRKGSSIVDRSSIAGRLSLSRSTSHSAYASAATIAAVTSGTSKVLVVPKPTEVQNHMEKIISRMVLALPSARPEDLSRATLLIWKNYTKRKLVTRLNKVDDLQDKVRQATETKSRILSSSFSTLSSILVIGFFLSIFYANFLMFQPYLMPFLLSLLVAIPLGIAKDYALSLVERIEDLINYRRSFAIKLMVLSIPVVSVALAVGSLFYSLNVFGLVIMPLLFTAVAALALASKANRDSILTISLIVWFVLILLFPLFFVLKSCVEESVIATNAIVDYINRSEELQALLQDYRQSPLYHRFLEYAATWGWDPSTLTPESLKEYLANAVQLAGQNINLFFGSAFNVIANIGGLVFSLIIFMTSLLTFLLNKKHIWSEISAISPFTAEEQNKLYRALGESVSRIFVCSFLIGIVHFWSTFLSFLIAGLELKYVFAALTAFLSIVPIFSTWIVWIPAALYLWSVGSIGSAILVAGVQITTTYIIDPRILAFIPGNPYFVGLSVVLGISTFGMVGVLLGPLLAGLVITSLDIYKSYYYKQPYSAD